MKCAIITPSYPPESAPAARRTAAWAAELRRRGHDVIIVTTAPHYPQRKIYDGYGARWIDTRVEGGVVVVRWRPVIAPARALVRRAIGDVVNAIALVWVLMRVRPSIVVTTIPPLPLAPFAWGAARLAGIRFVLDVRDLYWNYAKDLGSAGIRAASSIAEAVISAIARRADLVVTTNAIQRDYFVGVGVSADKTYVALNGVDRATLDTLAPRGCQSVGDETLRVAYVGLLGLVQGIGVLVEAAGMLLGEPWHIVIAGDGPEAAAIRTAVQSRSLANVELLGYLPSAGAMNVLRDADVLYAQLRGVNAASSALPSKLLEYMAAGKPIVYGGGGPGADVVREAGAGIVVPPDDAAAICEALRSLRAPGLRQQMGWKGRQFAERHEREKLAGEFAVRLERVESNVGQD